MPERIFVVTLKVEPPFDQYFPKITAARLSEVICEWIKDKSVSFIGQIPFEINVETVEGNNMVRGEIR